MTGNFWIDNAISAAGIAFVVFIIAFVFRHKPASLTKTRALQALLSDEPDFSPADWLHDHQGRATLAYDGKGHFVIVARVGIDTLTRRFKAGAVVVTQCEDRLSLDLKDMTLKPVEFNGVGDAAHWARLIRGDYDSL